MEGVGEWGLITVPYRFNTTLDEIQYNSGYYGMMQFSKYIKPGYKIIYTNDIQSLAAYGVQEKELVRRLTINTKPALTLKV